MKKNFYYFISFAFSKSLSDFSGVGHVELKTSKEITSIYDIEQIENIIKGNSDRKIVILNYQLLRIEEKEN